MREPLTWPLARKFSRIPDSDEKISDFLLFSSKKTCNFPIFCGNLRKKQESEIQSNPDIHRTLIPLKKVTESRKTCAKISKVPEYFLCNTKKLLPSIKIENSKFN